MLLGCLLPTALEGQFVKPILRHRNHGKQQRPLGHAGFQQWLTDEFLSSGKDREDWSRWPASQSPSERDCPLALSLSLCYSWDMGSEESRSQGGTCMWGCAW